MNHNFLDTIRLGDCRDLLHALPAASVDAILTDPPYGLGKRQPTGAELEQYFAGASLDMKGDFMGLAWEIPPVSVWRECLRVLRPGGYLAAFAGTRTWDIMAGGIRAAGFVRSERLTATFGSSVLQWLHGQGFPKSQNVSKALEKRAARNRDDASRLLSLAGRFRGYGTALKPAWEPILVYIKPGGAPADFEVNAPFCYAPKASRHERTVGGQIENAHPTVKPLKVMRWLVRAFAPAGGVVLDPYAGSGTTVEACLREGRHYVGLEREPNYHNIAVGRALVVRRELAANGSAVG